MTPVFCRKVALTAPWVLVWWKTLLGLLFKRIYEFYKEGGRESERFLCDFVLVVLFCEGLGWRKLLEKTLDTEWRKFGVAYEFTRRND